MAKLTIEIQPDQATRDQLDRIEGSLVALLGAITDLGVQMTALSDAVADVRARVTAKDEQQEALIAELRQQLDTAQTELLAALADDAADQATIDAKQAEIDQANASVAEKQSALDAANADAQSAIENLATINPAEAPPDDGGGEPPPGG